MPGQLIQCRCGHSFPAPSTSATVRCPKCRKAFQYIDFESVDVSKDLSATWKGISKSAATKTVARPKPRQQTRQVTGQLRSAVFWYFKEDPVRILVAFIMCALVLALALFAYQLQVQKAIPEYQMDFDLAEQLWTQGRKKDAARLYREIIPRAPAHSRTLRKAQERLAEAN